MQSNAEIWVQVGVYNGLPKEKKETQQKIEGLLTLTDYV